MIWNVHLNCDTYNFGGMEWVVDGEDGRRVYPGTWAECIVREYYQNGWPYDMDILEAIKWRETQQNKED